MGHYAEFSKAAKGATSLILLNQRQRCLTARAGEADPHGVLQEAFIA